MWGLETILSRRSSDFFCPVIVCCVRDTQFVATHTASSHLPAPVPQRSILRPVLTGSPSSLFLPVGPSFYLHLYGFPLRSLPSLRAASLVPLQRPLQLSRSHRSCLPSIRICLAFPSTPFCLLSSFFSHTLSNIAPFVRPCQVLAVIWGSDSTHHDFRRVLRTSGIPAQIICASQNEKKKIYPRSALSIVSNRSLRSFP